MKKVPIFEAGNLSYDDAKSQYKTSFSMKSIGYKPSAPLVKVVYRMANLMTATALDKYIKGKESSLQSWDRLVYGSTLSHNSAGDAAYKEWKDIVKKLYDILDKKTEGADLKSGSGKTIAIKGGKIYIDDKLVTVDRHYGFVHMDGKGPAHKMGAGTMHSGNSDIGKNQLQGITYTNVFNQFKKLVTDGKTWEEIDDLMNTKSRGPIHGEEPGTTWKAIKKYLSL